MDDRHRLRGWSRFWTGALWSSLLGAWFFLVYGLCNAWTAKSGRAGTLYWEWEKHIPFVPEFIVPYFSLDVLFAVAFFICSTRQELRVLCWRIFTVILLSGICFLIWPLQLGIERPLPDGWTRPWFELLHAQDLPYNMAPSLHISLRAIFWITYGRHMRGIGRSAMKFWFILIGVSTLLVWQHHLIDIATGFLMGWLVVALIPDPVVQHGPAGFVGVITAAHRRLAFRYGIAAVLCALLAIPGGGYILFAWPAVGLTITALAYALANPRLLQKSSGTISPGAEWVMLPIMLAARFIQRRWRSPVLSPQQVHDTVRYGRMPTAAEAKDLIQQGCCAVVDLTAESSLPSPLREGVPCVFLATLDLTLPTHDTLDRAVSFIQEHESDGFVYVCCQLGLSRSALVAAAWLWHSGKAVDAEDAVKQLRAQYSSVVLSSEAVSHLRKWKQPSDTLPSSLAAP